MPPKTRAETELKCLCDIGHPRTGRPALIGMCACVDAWVVDEITILQAGILKTLASPRRLEILHALAGGPIEVGRLARSLGASQPNVSQHLAVLRGAGIVEPERTGREVRYRLVDPDVMVACGVMRAVLERRLTRLGAIAESRPAAAAPVAAARSAASSKRSAERSV
jgi:DNA-binding transcriptional ArsR family regulator